MSNGSSNLFLASSNSSTEQDESDSDSDDDDQETDDDESNDDNDETDTESEDEDTDDEESDEDETDDDSTNMTPAAIVGEQTFFSASQLAASLAPSLDSSEGVAGLLETHATFSATTVDSAFVSLDPTGDALLAASVSLENASAIDAALGQTAVPEPSTWLLAALAILALQVTRLRLRLTWAITDAMF
ncbi:MAG: PEP-CTERM sorting domain-containing protein [Planctomycetes bacterium]|nr:PEP-CTERM sorting domain-containing protein [Planctomycetota bacterium]